MKMGSSVDFYLYSKNKDTKEYENISWRSFNNIIPMFTGYSTYVQMVKDCFKCATDYKKETFNFLNNSNLNNYYIKKLNDIKYLEPIQKIMYIHYDFIDMLKNDELYEEDSEYIYCDIDKEYDFPIVLDPRIYGQLIQEEKQKYVPFILKADDRNDIYEMKIAEICHNWISEFAWSDYNNDKYDLDNALVVAYIFT